MSHSFNDARGASWTVALDAAAVDRIRERTGVDLRDAGSLLGLAGVPVKLVAVIYTACESEVLARGMTPEDFGRALAGDAIADAVRALIDELAGLAGGPRARAMLLHGQRRIRLAMRKDARAARRRKGGR